MPEYEDNFGVGMTKRLIIFTFFSFITISNISFAQISMSPNAKLNVYGNEWTCKTGFKKSSSGCIKMTPKEVEQQRRQIKISMMRAMARSSSGKCSDAYTSADEAYDCARKGYNSDTFDELHYYARKAKNSEDDAMSYASDCGCDDAYSAADDVYTYARRAYSEDSDFDYDQCYMRRAKNSADDAKSYADDRN